MVMSVMKVFHERREANDMRVVRPSLDKVGLAESRSPARASGSRKPGVISRAFARGLPSGCLDHFSMKWALSTLFAGASPSCENSHTWFIKNDSSSFFACMNDTLSAKDMALSLKLLRASFCLVSLVPA